MPRYKVWVGATTWMTDADSMSDCVNDVLQENEVRPNSETEYELQVSIRRIEG